MRQTYNWKFLATPNEKGYFDLKTEETGEVPVRLFLSQKLLDESEDQLYEQIVNATKFPGVKLVVITPDTHYGYGVPVGCVMVTDGTACLGPVGYDIGCFSAETQVPLVDGRFLSIEDLAREGEFWVWSVDSNKNIVPAKATAKLTRKDTQLYRVTLDNRKEIYATPDHEFMLRDGSYKRVDALTTSDSLMPFYTESDRDGYISIKQPSTGKYRRAHWAVADAGLLGPLPEVSEDQHVIIHHKNFMEWDNRPENLEFMGNRDHTSFHKKIRERNPHFQSPEFEAKRVAALGAKAQTKEGHEEFHDRYERNLKHYWDDNKELLRELTKDNGQRGKEYLTSYNTSDKGRAKSSEIGNRMYTCELCGESVKGGLGLHHHRKYKHQYNHKILHIEKTGRVEDVYCLTVPEHGNFALDAGVFVHNCGMMSARSEVEAAAATPEKRLQFNKEVMKRVEMGAGGNSHSLRGLSQDKFVDLIKGGADLYARNYGGKFDRSRAERNRIPVDDDYSIPWGGRGRPERGISQIGSLGGGNHFIELQRDEVTGTLFVQVHTGSRGFGHGLATNYFDLAKAENPKITQLDLGYFEPESKHYKDYMNAVAAGGNFAILNRLVIFEQVAEAFEATFGEPMELVYEISHNLVQHEWSEEFGMCYVHRKGATRAFPAGHPNLRGTLFEDTGHPVLIPGSNKAYSYILRPLPKVKEAAYSVNHGAGRKLSRGKAKLLDQDKVNAEYKAAGVIVNDNAPVPLDESAEAYKDSEEVISVITDAELAVIEHKLWPLSSLKGLS